jgi:hypothetical protein
VNATFVEGDLVFDFDQRWTVVKWDEHPAYRGHGALGRAQGARAVDFVALLDGSSLWLIEVGDVRGRKRRISNRNARRSSSEPLEVELGTKGRDTLAGLTWAHQRSKESSELLGHLRVAWEKAPASRIRVVSWLEGVDAAQALALKEGAERRLGWLNPRCVVTNSDLRASTEGSFPSVRVAFAPRHRR